MVDEGCRVEPIINLALNYLLKQCRVDTDGFILKEVRTKDGHFTQYWKRIRRCQMNIRDDFECVFCVKLSEYGLQSTLRQEESMERFLQRHAAGSPDVSYNLVSFSDGIYYVGEDYFLAYGQLQIPPDRLFHLLAQHFCGDICSIVLSYSDACLRSRYQHFGSSRFFPNHMAPQVSETRWDRLIPPPIKIILDSQLFSKSQQLCLLGLLGRLHWLGSYRRDAWKVRLHLHGKQWRGGGLLISPLVVRSEFLDHSEAQIFDFGRMPLEDEWDRILISDLDEIPESNRSNDFPHYYHVPFRFVVPCLDSNYSSLYWKLNNIEPAETFRCLMLYYKTLLQIVGPNCWSVSSFRSSDL
jgi:hypothetical protein